LSAFVRLYFAPAQNSGTRRSFQQQHPLELEQEPDMMSDVTIVASVVTIQAVF
jgi:hypothetical protein